MALLLIYSLCQRVFIHVIAFILLSSFISQHVESAFQPFRYIHKTSQVFSGNELNCGANQNNREMGIKKGYLEQIPLSFPFL